jgi:serine/threonine kinase 32
MVMDLMLGGDLRFHLDRQGNFKENHIAFIVAECSLALNYLHSKNVVHRDLKPDNSKFLFIQSWLMSVDTII